MEIIEGFGRPTDSFQQHRLSHSQVTKEGTLRLGHSFLGQS